MLEVRSTFLEEAFEGLLPPSLPLSLYFSIFSFFSSFFLLCEDVVPQVPALANCSHAYFTILDCL